MAHVQYRVTVYVYTDHLAYRTGLVLFYISSVSNLKE